MNNGRGNELRPNWSAGSQQGPQETTSGGYVYFVKHLKNPEWNTSYGGIHVSDLEKMYQSGNTLSQSQINKLTREQKEEVAEAERSQSIAVVNIPKSRIVDNALNVPIKNSSNDIILHVPFNKAVCPVLELFMYDFPGGYKQLYGAGTFSMRQALAWFYGEEDDKDYRDRWHKFFRINKGDTDAEKEKPVKVKVPKVKAENQLLYLDDLIYELPNADQFKSKRAQRLEHDNLDKRNEVFEEFEDLYNKNIVNLMPEDSELTEEEKKKVAFDLYKRGYFKDGIEYTGQDNDGLSPDRRDITPIKSATTEFTPISVMHAQPSRLGGTQFGVDPGLGGSQMEGEKKIDNE